MPLAEPLQRIADDALAYVSNPSGTPPYSVYVYDPEDDFAVRRDMTDLSAYLTAHGVDVAAISLSALFWKAVDESGFFDEIVNVEKGNPGDSWGLEQVHETLHEILTAEPSLAARVLTAARDKPSNCVVILYRAGALYPVFRTSALLDDLRDRLMHPVVLLYPGHVVDPYGLKFMGLREATHGYRAKIFRREAT